MAACREICAAIGPTLSILALLGVSGCRACDGPSTPTALLDRVPAEADLVLLLDLPRVADELRQVSPYAAFPSRWRDLVEQLDAYSRERLGVGLAEAHTLAFWQVDGSWGGAVSGDFEGEPSGETVDVGGTRAVRLDPDLYLARHGDYLLVGNLEGLTLGAAVAAGTAPHLEGSSEHSAELLRELLESQGGAIASLASLGSAPFAEDLSALGIDVRAVGVSWRAQEWTARVALPDATAADRALEQVNEALEMGLTMVRQAAESARTDEPGEAVAAIISASAAELFAEELIQLEVDDEMLVVTLDLRSMQSGAAIVAGMASLSVPTYFRYVRRAQTVEVDAQLRVIFDAATAYYEQTHVGIDGQALPPQFPGPAPRTPAAVPCGQEAQADGALWEHPTWEALHFVPTGPLRYSYEFQSSGTGDGAWFRVGAYGDLDCDGVLSTFEYSGAVSNGVVESGSLLSLDELE